MGFSLACQSQALKKILLDFSSMLGFAAFKFGDNLRVSVIDLPRDHAPRIFRPIAGGDANGLQRTIKPLGFESVCWQSSHDLKHPKYPRRGVYQKVRKFTYNN